MCKFYRTCACNMTSSEGTYKSSYLLIFLYRVENTSENNGIVLIIVKWTNVTEENPLFSDVFSTRYRRIRRWDYSYVPSLDVILQAHVRLHFLILNVTSPHISIRCTCYTVRNIRWFRYDISLDAIIQLSVMKILKW